jgi:hypothetical protein
MKCIAFLGWAVEALDFGADVAEHGLDDALKFKLDEERKKPFLFPGAPNYQPWPGEPGYEPHGGLV